jgi:hypothetical protein
MIMNSTSNTESYTVGFQITGSRLILEKFVEWFFIQVGPKTEHVFIENSRGEFWQQDRMCPDCYSHFFENADTVGKLECLKCGKECDIQ